MEGDHPQNYWHISEKSSAEHRQNFQMSNEPAMCGRARPPASSSGGFLSASQRYGVQDRTNVGQKELWSEERPPLPVADLYRVLNP